VLAGLARRAIEVLKKVRGAQDVNIEQEGPQPQLVILPDRRLCARYNVPHGRRHETHQTRALGGEPIGTLYEGERAVRYRGQIGPVRHEIAPGGRTPAVHNADGGARAVGTNWPASSSATARRSSPGKNGRRRLTVRCDIVGRDQGGFVREAQKRFETEMASRCPTAIAFEWLGMFENLQRARTISFSSFPLPSG